MSAADTSAPLLKTPLHALHIELGAKMVPFGGYDMPVQYPAGVMAEHKHTRAAAGLFDVSHMGQVRLIGDGAAAALETIVPVDVIDLGLFKQRYALFTNEQGGILDDLMIARRPDDLFVVVNAGCKVQDIAHMQAKIGDKCQVLPLPEQALLALQGPQAVTALSRLNADVAKLTFMTGGFFNLDGIDTFLTRSGYTGEDGFEISVHQDQAVELARKLLAQPEVKPIGLGARDSLRLEAGLCLYGHDIDTSTTPVEASLTWAIQKVRRAGGARAGGYPGAAVVDEQLANGAARKRVGLVSSERMPVREGAKLVNAEGVEIGVVTSGTLGPTVGKPVALAYLAKEFAAMGTEVFAIVRDKRTPMTVSSTPFTPNGYFRG
ncbi:glycine cleavage system aminomethyltransferase GcvT [Paucibacter sp. DJ2R-2]|uniref:glycine cleavage system aminomethyltransferase GcvT n=1 Tax=Paucibacter sp. DJ2R-2 TaxID=2893558 RepID=UPI0021E434AA|nr:glycine cleavage system aminomethyltransferase GcvT [Paucibacter sp. DJ2R-2]MCV2420513.1 glycine cleavage system aminomethyltransferase GcvT [Paucibacter sp. DJ4R-1]MCV2439691.1 glycine cleavage system aminomethyltransferase GcvT [Paucibacter sp. DJ2R-2]